HFTHLVGFDVRPQSAHKMSEVIRMQLDMGFRQMKCATIAEAEMLALEGVPDILLAYQPVGPNVQRLLRLVQQHPELRISALVDDRQVAEHCNAVFQTAGAQLTVFIDIDNGGHRTGIAPGDAALALYDYCHRAEALNIRGLHVYDGHVRMPSFAERQQKINEGFKAVEHMIAQLEVKYNTKPLVIAGGTPAFPVHASRTSVICSPGTCVLWDWGYGSAYEEMDFQYAGLVMSRIISKPSNNLLTCDLGHKAIAPDKPIPRVHFLNLPEAKHVGHSEEHMVLKVEDNANYEIGMVLYGVPIHICPTCALHETALVVRNHEVVDRWSVVSRKRVLSV
ncbi:MAG: D-TA family PLP-dependent enzyme, partial [Bacteroidota bacterium]